MNAKLAPFAVAALTVVATLAPLGSAPAMAAPSPRVIWVSPRGSDSNTGEARTTPIRTLGRAHRLLCPATGCPGLGVPVEVRLEPGTHYLPDTGWQYFDDTYPTRFVPADWRPGWTWPDVSAHGGRPRLDGRFTTVVGLRFTPHRASSTGRNNLEFHYLEWRRYNDYALQIRGSSTHRPAGNLVSGNLFRYVGNYWNPSHTIGYGGISLWTTSRNTIRDSHFISIVNAPSDSNGHEHGTYLIQASNNVIQSNRFLDIGGDAVRVANQSNNNLVVSNTFERVSNRGHVSDWYCRDLSKCPKLQSPSYGNIARRNTFRSFYPGWWTINPRKVFCYDKTGGLCPSNRIKLEP